jgi:filamentous hemagglutinin
MVRDLPTIRGTQVGLKNPALVDQIKAQMRSGQFTYDEIGCRVIGIRDHEETYHVKDGHHRMVAAFELHWETGDSSFVKNLITFGRWDDTGNPPIDSCSLPARTLWRAIRN